MKSGNWLLTFSSLFILLFILQLVLGASNALAAEAIILGKIYKKDSAHNSCTSSRYYYGTPSDNNCAADSCRGGPNYNITWTQGGNSDWADAGSCDTIEGDYRPRYTFETGHTTPSSDSDGENVSVRVQINLDAAKVNKWFRNTTYSDGTGCKLGESGTLPNPASDATINVTVYSDGDCKWNHVWFWYEDYPSASISGPTSGITNQSLSFTVNASSISSLSKGYLYVATTNRNNPWPYSCPGTIDGEWCSLVTNNSVSLSGSSSSFSVNWAPTTANTYYVATNIVNTANNWCGSNPWGNPTNWADCGNGRLQLTVTDPTPTPTNTPTPSPTPIPPTINSLKVNNSSGSQTTFSGQYTISGNQSNQNGSNWLNPMTITVDATPGSGSISQYFVSFYDKKRGTSSIQPAYTTVVDGLAKEPVAKSLLSSDYTAGFALRFDPPNTHYVWDPYLNNGNGSWVNINSYNWGYQVCGKKTDGSLDCFNKTFYTVFPISSLPSWKVQIDKNFGSKNLYTAVQVYNDKGSTTTNPNIAPIP